MKKLILLAAAGRPKRRRSRTAMEVKRSQFVSLDTLLVVGQDLNRRMAEILALREKVRSLEKAGKETRRRATKAWEKAETFKSRGVEECTLLDQRLGMADECVRQAVDTAWTVYRATHDDVHEMDERRCLLELHLQERWEPQEDAVERLTCVGLAYLERLDSW